MSTKSSPNGLVEVPTLFPQDAEISSDLHLIATALGRICAVLEERLPPSNSDWAAPLFENGTVSPLDEPEPEPQQEGTPLSTLELSGRAEHAVAALGVSCCEHLESVSPAMLKTVKYCGPLTIREIVRALTIQGRSLQPDPDPPNKRSRRKK